VGGVWAYIVIKRLARFRSNNRMNDNQLTSKKTDQESIWLKMCAELLQFYCRIYHLNQLSVRLRNAENGFQRIVKLYELTYLYRTTRNIVSVFLKCLCVSNISSAEAKRRSGLSFFVSRSFLARLLRKKWERILMNVCAMVRHGPRRNWLHSGGDPSFFVASAWSVTTMR